MIETITHAFAAAFMVFWGCNIRVSGGRGDYLILYLINKVVPVIVGLSFAFDLYAQFMGWPA